ncbi:MAG TPA: tRNA dihydrouridine(20/20a) synthase DusA, partial [Gammaproteobacteria bacterium]|nr:tRNA dihydrouridine(20/20a) synthase DusA [Gammaproteobacteria bacterium]MCH76985.1 tRNA dihydrouridine(20/20a) synthase DusA [Gammaproteobacteria bacterium]
LRPELEIVINGGITDLDQALAHLGHVDGVMIGRAAYHSPWLLADVDRRIFGAATPPPERAQVLAQYIGYMDHQLGAGTPITALTRPLLGLFQGQPGARAWRRTLSTPDTARDLGRVWAAAQHVLEPGQLAGTCAA